MNSIQRKYFPTAARLEITEFGDFGTPRSRQARKVIDAVVKMHEGEVTYQYRHYPNPDHKESLLAAFALEAAKRQDQLMPMYEALLNVPVITCPTLIAQALQLGFDQQQFMDDMADENLRTKIKLDWEAGYRLGVCNTPTLFVDGYRFYGKFTLSRLLPFVHSHLIRQGGLVNHPSFVDQMLRDQQQSYALE